MWYRSDHRLEGHEAKRYQSALPLEESVAKQYRLGCSLEEHVGMYCRLERLYVLSDRVYAAQNYARFTCRSHSEWSCSRREKRHGDDEGENFAEHVLGSRSSDMNLSFKTLLYFTLKQDSNLINRTISALSLP